MINRRFFNYKTYNAFLRDKENIPSDALVFIQDRKVIWVKGVEYVGTGIGDVSISGSTFAFKDTQGNAKFTITAQNGNLIVRDANGNEIASQNLTVDSQLDGTSSNPVQNKAIKAILDTKADKTSLDEYVKILQFNQQLNSKQDKLTAGSGIKIERNTISSTVDTEVYKIVTQLPDKSNADPNKIYLLESMTSGGSYTYTQYRLRNNVWVSFGMTGPTIDMSLYLKSQDAEATYQHKGNYITAVDLIPYATVTQVQNIQQELNNYALTDYVTGNFQPKGDYATKSYVDDNFVRRTEVYTPEQGDLGSNASISEGGSQVIVDPISVNIEVDDFLSMASSNPVENRVITMELATKVSRQDLQDYATSLQLDNKADVSTLQNYTTLDQFTQALDNKQDILTAGDGISIIDNVISANLDTNVFVIVDELPTVNISPDKLYLVESTSNGESTYTQWRYEDGNWREIGPATPSIDLSSYLTKANAASSYQPIGNYITEERALGLFQRAGSYVTSDYANNTFQVIGDYATNAALEALRTNINNTFQRKGSYASVAAVERALITLQQIIDEKYVLKRDMYNPLDMTFSSSQPTSISLPQGSGSSGSGESGEGGESGESGGETQLSSMVTLTVQQYHNMQLAGLIQEDVYYFTYEEEEEEPAEQVEYVTVNNTLYTTGGTDEVVGSTLIINSTNASVDQNTLYL